MLACQAIDSETERAHYYLDIWRAWMTHHSHRLGFNPRSPIVGKYSGQASTNDYYDQIDSHAAQIVDAVLGDLPLSQSRAVDHYILGARKFPNDDWQGALAAIPAKLTARGLP